MVNDGINAVSKLDLGLCLGKHIGQHISKAKIGHVYRAYTFCYTSVTRGSF